MSNSNSASTPEALHEITSLISQVKTLDIDVFSNVSNPQPIAICHPCGPRWLSLSTYKEATSLFDYWDENTNKDGFNTVRATINGDNIQDDDDIMSDSQISHFELDESETEGELDPFQDAESRVLGALRSYQFNLVTGTLATSERVDEGVKNALQKLMKLSEGGLGSLASSEGVKVSERGKMGEPSDEERMVAELEWYMKQVLIHEVKPDQAVVAVAGEIIEWATKGGIVDRGDLC